MKNIIKILSIAFLACAFLMSCEGPAGPLGADGADGISGVDGVDGNAVCLECHNETTRDLVAEQYEESTHGTSNLMYTGQTVYEYTNSEECGKCHSNEGFKETQHTGLDTIFAPYGIPTRIQCETCHDFHETLDFSDSTNVDYALRTRTSVALLMDDGATFLDFGNNSNLCTNCHQPRTAAPVDPGSGFVEITSKYYGPHHGPQSTILAGIKAYEISGSTSYPSSDHAHKAGACNECHMNEQNHTMEADLDACKVCHEGATDFDVEDVQTDVASKLAELKTALTNASLLDGDGYPVPGTYGIDTVGIIYNYKTVQEDRSMGVHNPPYILALLQNSIEAL